MIKIILGPSGSGKTTELFQAVTEGAVLSGNISDSLKKNFIVVIPEQFSLSVTRKLASMNPRKGIINIDVLSFARFAHRIFDSSGRGKVKILDDTGKNLILRRIAGQVSDKLKVLSGTLRRQGYINEIKSAISEFVQYDISPEDVAIMSEEVGSSTYLGTKLKDLSLIYEGFRDSMKDKYLTREELLDAAVSVMDRAAFLKEAHIVFDNFTGFTPIQYRFIEKLCELAEELDFAFDYDGREKAQNSLSYRSGADNDLFTMTLRSLAGLKGIAENTGHEFLILDRSSTGSKRVMKDSPLEYLESHLFRGGSQLKKYNGPLNETINILEFNRPETEAAYICAEVKRLIRTQGLKYGDIGIVCGSEAYYKLISIEARKRDIPVFIDSTDPIRLNPFIELLRAAIQVELTRFSYEAVLHFLRTGLIALEKDDIDLAENHVRKYGIRGKSAYGKPWEQGKPGEELTEEQGLKYERINKVRDYLSRAFGPLDSVIRKRSAAAKDYTKAIRDFVELIGVKEALQDLEPKFRESGDMGAADEYGQIYEKLDELFTKIEELLPDEVMSFREYSDILTSGFDEIRIGVIPPKPDQVTIGDQTRSRFENIKILIFAGLDESAVPARASVGGILTDHDKERVKEAFTGHISSDAPLQETPHKGRQYEFAPGAKEKIITEKLMFYMCVTKPSERLYLTYSGVNVGEKCVRPSWFLKSILRLFPDIEIKRISSEAVYRDFETENDAFEGLVLGLKSAGKETGFGAADDSEGSAALSESGKAELYKYFAKSSKYRDRLQRTKKSIFDIYKATPLSRAAADILRERRRFLSPSMLEQYSACPYEYFLKYSLGLKEREEFGFEKRDLGTILHEILELMPEAAKSLGKPWYEMGDAELLEVCDKAIALSLKPERVEVLRSSERNAYFLDRIKRIIHRTLTNLIYQKSAGSFVPVEFERKFFFGGLQGKIDRIDLADLREGKAVSIIDYKSGNKAFDLSRIYWGLDLQLPLYLTAALEIERDNYPGNEIIPGGFFFYHIDDPVIDSKDLKVGTADEAEEKRKKEFKLRGLVNSDSEVIALFDRKALTSSSDVVQAAFNMDGTLSRYKSSAAAVDEIGCIEEYVNGFITRLQEKMDQGDISRVPAVYGNDSTCKYCDYRDACPFDVRKAGYEERFLKKFSKDSDILERMKLEIH